jgi:hypothetical protein
MTPTRVGHHFEESCCDSKLINSTSCARRVLGAKSRSRCFDFHELWDIAVRLLDQEPLIAS